MAEQKEKTVVVADTFIDSLANVLGRECKLPAVTKSEKAGHLMRDLDKNKNWKKRWKDFIKYDYDWDGVFLLEIIMHKLKLIQERYNSDKMSDFMAEESLKPIQDSINECVELGEKILNYDYGAVSDQYLKDNTNNGHELFIMRDGQKTVLFQALDDEDLPLISSMKKCVEEKKCLISQYPQDQILLAYFSNWKDQACVEVWTEMLKKAHKEEEKDTKKFFTLIAKNYKLWWD